jgi:hypothetical protein
MVFDTKCGAVIYRLGQSGIFRTGPTAMNHSEIAELLAKPTITPGELLLSNILPLSRNGIYEAIKNGEIEAICYGKKKAIVTAPLRKKLGL